MIYPILVRDCSFPACHAADDRFFRVYAPGRGRLSPDDTALSGPVTGTELEQAWERSRSMLAMAESPEESLLLRKPLEIDRGGAPHMGLDQYGRDVFDDREHPSYVALLEWARGGTPAAALRDDGAAVLPPEGGP